MTPQTTIPMPRLTEQMEEATIARWLVEPGEPVAIGDELVEIETDKATIAYVSEAAGHLEQLVEEGESVTVGLPIAVLRPTAAPTPGDRPAPDGQGTPLSPTTAAGPSEASDRTGAHRAAERPSADVQATPLARRIAEDLGVALGAVQGTGPRGRILQEDVLRAAGRVQEPVARRAVAPTAAPSARTRIDLVAVAAEQRPLSTIQRTIARRMAESKATVPHFQVSCDVTVDAAMSTRRELLGHLAEGVRGPSLNDFIVRACALALRDHELVNASFAGDHFELHPGIHVGVAVATDAGLLVATVTDTDRRSLFSIADETRRLAATVRAGTATPTELAGATFTISNLGMFGMTSIVPVINPPQAAILGVGAAREELYLHDGRATVRHVATLTLSGDHRILNGADAARFLIDVKRLVQSPLLMLSS